MFELLTHRSASRHAEGDPAFRMFRDMKPSGALDGFRLATRRMDGARASSIGVTSAMRGDGRSTVALGMALVQRYDHGRKVLLLDLDLEHPSLASRLGMAAVPGIAEMVRNQASAEECVVWIGEDFGVVPAGNPVDPGRTFAELIREDRLRLFERWCDVLVADLPSILESGLGAELSRLFAVQVLVVRAGVTPIPRVEEAVGELHAEPAIVLNGVESSAPAWVRRLAGDD